MVDVTTYDPKKVSIVVNNRMITGFCQRQHDYCRPQ